MSHFLWRATDSSHRFLSNVQPSSRFFSIFARSLSGMLASISFMST